VRYLCLGIPITSSIIGFESNNQENYLKIISLSKSHAIVSKLYSRPGQRKPQAIRDIFFDIGIILCVAYFLILVC